MTAKAGPRHLAEPPTFTRSFRLTDEQLDQKMDVLIGTYEPAFWDALVDARVAAVSDTVWTTQDVPQRGPLREHRLVIDLIATVAVEPWHPAPLTRTGRRVKAAA